jgi:NADPH:quinone reductase-like Zn-dependent oxidoreductase
VHTSSLNGFDAAVLSGYIAQYLEHQFPVTLGRDYAGTIDQVGDGVESVEVGTEVFGVVLGYPLHAGGFGEYVTVPAASVARVPAGLDLATAGVLGLAGSAASTLLSTVALRAGETILVSGATGGVGNIAIQLAAAGGATVIATAAPGPETDHVRDLGAHHVVDYTADVAEQVRAIAPDGVDVALHLAGDPLAIADLIAPGGRFASLLGAGPEQMGDRDLVAHSVNAALLPSQWDELAAHVVAGRLNIPVQRTYRLDDVPAAFADFAGGTLGKLAVSVE